MSQFIKKERKKTRKWNGTCCNGQEEIGPGLTVNETFNSIGHSGLMRHLYDGFGDEMFSADHNRTRLDCFCWDLGVPLFSQT